MFDSFTQPVCSNTHSEIAEFVCGLFGDIFISRAGIDILICQLVASNCGNPGQFCTENQKDLTCPKKFFSVLWQMKWMIIKCLLRLMLKGLFCTVISMNHAKKRD